MKLKFATRIYIAVNAFAILFRTVQIMFMTESNTAFLKQNLIVLNVIGTVFVVLLLIYMTLNTFLATRQPVGINSSGIPMAVVSGISGVLYCICGGLSFVNHGTAWRIIFVLSLAAALFSFLFTASSVLDYRFPKAAALMPVAFWMGEFIVAYIYSTECSLRVRTVYETFALTLSLLFFICFGKLYSGVSKEKNFRLLYPLGLLASSLCFISVTPEFIARVFGFSDKVSVSCTPETALMGGGLFIAAVTLNTFKKSNTVRPASRERRKTAEASSDDSYVGDGNIPE